MKNQTAVMCHNIAKYNREKPMSNEINHAEVAERLEDMADASDRESTGPMYLDQHVRTGLINVPTDDADAMRIAAADERRIANGELAEVVYAHWLRVDDFTSECSHCGDFEKRDIEDDTPYCPYCGALMDESRDGNYLSGEQKEKNDE